LLTGLVAVGYLAAFVQCSSSSDKAVGTDKAKGSTCSGAQALQSDALRGASLPPKTLALTFDDGPGARTKQLSAYLKSEGIEAAFFVNGRAMGPDADDIFKAVLADGHIIANHTETHRSLTGVSTATARLSNDDVIQEITLTDKKIDGFVPTGRYMFRPPYGDYDAQTFGVIAPTPMNKYIGPVLWDIGDRMDVANGRAADWDCWQDGSDGKRYPMKTCGDLYLTEIRHATKGIVLMHDPYFNDADPQQLGTVDMVMYMVPILKSEGFSFTRVDKVPQISALLPALPPDQNTDTPKAGNTGNGAAQAAPNTASDTSPTEPAPDDPCH
jgi:peptidoglycan/xylan/chitin deacetylase (PgdA/CDA1 family)